MNIKQFGAGLKAVLKRLGDKLGTYKINKRIAVIAGAAVVLAAAVLLATARHTDVNDEVEPSYSFGTDYSMNLQHYAGFDHSDTHIGIYLDWQESSIVMRDNSAETQIKAKIKPINLDNIKLSWRVSDDNIAEIDENGHITAKNPGTVDIYAEITGENAVKTAKATLTVIQPVTGIFMPVTTTTLYMGSTGQLLEADIFPQNCTNQNIIWQTKDDKIASVDENGHVRPVGVGMTEITATTQEGGFVSKCFVSVVNYSVKPESVTIQNEYKNDAYLKVGEGFTIITSVMPSNAKDKTLRWTSADESVATISQTGKVKAISEGQTVITAATTNGKQDTLTLTVQPSDTVDAFNLDPIEEQIPGSIYGMPITNGMVTYTPYDMTLLWMVRLQMGLDPPPKKNGASQYASESETAEYMNPANYCTGAYKYQFLDLSHANGISEEALNAFLADKGVLRGHAADFIAAANEYSISEVYLVAHSCLETGNGSSTLATGVSVNGTTVYNMFGIGAYDSSAVYSGSQKAYKEGWTTVSEAIRGGAKWISDFYVNSPDGRQNTLYKMLWNPDNPGTHQYATDIQWAAIQGINMEKIFRSFPDAVKSYEVPVYSGMIAPVLDAN